jgi:hypothetical protein
MNREAGEKVRLVDIAGAVGETVAELEEEVAIDAGSKKQ